MGEHRHQDVVVAVPNRRAGLRVLLLRLRRTLWDAVLGLLGLSVLRLPLRGLLALRLDAVRRLLRLLAVGRGSGRRREAGLALAVLGLLRLHGGLLAVLGLLGLSVLRLPLRGAVLLLSVGLVCSGGRLRLSVGGLPVGRLGAGGRLRLSVGLLLVARLPARRRLRLLVARLFAVLLLSVGGLCAGGRLRLSVGGLSVGLLAAGGRLRLSVGLLLVARLGAGRLCVGLLVARLFAVLLLCVGLLCAGGRLRLPVLRGVGGRGLRLLLLPVPCLFVALLLAGPVSLVRVFRGRGVRRGLAHALPRLR
ncbi:hypothetical protein [Nocardiopsis flavescens]|uniref:hypothetical protein n=1 Tax=Nocardiopsis flavescens TaxID=758803 RepID=UPI001160FE16|nr:hypothetical protein [Nocardiopsis flavescens]